MTEAAQEELSQPLGVILVALCFTVITANLYHLDEMGLDEIGLDEMGMYMSKTQCVRLWLSAS